MADDEAQLEVDDASTAEQDDIMDDTDQQNNEDSDEEEEEEEPECRVCRGPAEEGRPLFAPCKCSGSIGLTHQDCLTSWLQVTRGVRCELCSYRFQFAPEYAVGTPEHLPPHEVLLGLSRRLLARWLPFCVRFAFAALCWFMVVPLLTAYLYHGWMHRPSSIYARMKWDLVIGDAVSGAVIAAVIIVSFLSLMSLADFLRFHWQEQQDVVAAAAAAQGVVGEQQQQQAQEAVHQRRRRRLLLQGGNDNDNNNDNVEDGHIPDDDEQGDGIDREILHHANFRLRQQDDVQPVGVMDQRQQPLFVDNNNRERGDDAQQRHVQWMDRAPAPPAQEQARPPPPGGEEDHQRDLPDDPEERRLELLRRIRRQLDDMEGDADRVMERNALGDLAADLAGENELELEALRERDARRQELEEDDVDRFAQMMQAQEEEVRRNPQHDRQDAPVVPPAGNNNDRFEPQFEPLPPLMNQDNVEDMEIHVALDELLGLRGPFFALIRNILWLMAFITTYLGIFAFVPRTIGLSMYSTASNTTVVNGIIKSIPYLNSTDPDAFSVLGIVSNLNAESERLNTTLRLPDLAIVALGYFVMAVLVKLWQVVIFMSRLLRKPREENDEQGQEPVGERAGGRRVQDVAALRAAREVLHHEVERLNIDEDNRARIDAALFEGDHRPDDEDMRVAFGQKLSLALECAGAVVKVCILLFLKMLLLPLLLGIWLDAATLDLFGSTANDRILYAGSDLFGSLLLHWVAGITFMLFVTVSVLQLREVTHPDLLARVIRPQEPQPDLLGNLLQETSMTHAKRMALSLCIYAVILMVHVWLPARLLVSAGMGKYLLFFQPKLWHIVLPQLQLPIELLVIHLSMLSFLEKYKNSIGEMQHHWLVFVCDKMGLTEQLLPHTIEKFVLVGSRPIFVKNSNEGHDSISGDDEVIFATSGSSTEGEDTVHHSDISESENYRQKIRDGMEIDPFWYRLASKPEPGDHFILSNIEVVSPSAPPVYETGIRKRNGERALSSSQAFILLPQKQSPPSADSLRNGSTTVYAIAGKNLLPTTMGAYRLRRRERNDGTMVIEFWREVVGDPIPRPPEGWDDLNAGGAEVQGRWAWGKERKSEIEGSVAQRTPFFGRSWFSAFLLAFKIALLLLLSWLTITILVCSVLSAPLFAGRLIFYLLRVPDGCVHDPLAFAIGGSILIPTIGLVGGFLIGHSDSLWRRFFRWTLGMFRRPPSKKLLVLFWTAVLWLVISPLALGVLYDLLFVKSREWFLLEEPLADMSSLIMSWGVGTMLLNIWACLCCVGAFTGEFWADIIGIAVVEFQQDGEQANNGQHEAGADREALGGPQHDAGPPADPQAVDSLWQGENGRIARFVAIWKDVLLGWEWDRVDSVVLLQECALLIARQLVASCLLPLIAYIVWLFALDSPHNAAGVVLPMVGVVGRGLYRMVVFRMFAALTLTIQLAKSFQTPLQGWFRAAHKAARNDRYLVGEVLMNYVAPPQQETEESPSKTG